MHVTSQLGRYNMILGRNLLQEQGIDLDFKENSITWEDYNANMKPADIMLEEHVANIEATKAAATEIAKILDTEYHKKHNKIFGGTLGTWKNSITTLHFKKLSNHITADHTRIKIIQSSTLYRGRPPI
eukprot:6181436-Ditylum_brightwellii.AAC.1